MIGFAMCGSFCNHANAISVLEQFVSCGEEVLPILSETVFSTDTRFGKASDFVEKTERITGHGAIHTIEKAEPIGPKIKLDALVICPCTGNTAAKMAHGICDTAVTMAAKAHLRNEMPLIIAFASNDGLSMAAPNIGLLLQRRNIFFVPMREDDPKNKTRSLVCDFSRVYDTFLLAKSGKQIQPIVF